MKNFLNLGLIIMAAVMIEGCNTAKYAEKGVGYSLEEEIAKDKADLNAAVNAAKESNYTVREDARIETKDLNGTSTTVYTSTREGHTEATFNDNTFDRKTTNKKGVYRTETEFKGNTEKR